MRIPEIELQILQNLRSTCPLKTDNPCLGEPILEEGQHCGLDREPGFSVDEFSRACRTILYLSLQ